MSKTEALRLADELEEAAGEYWRFQKSTGYGAAAELRRLSAENNLLHQRHHDDNAEYTRVLAQRDALLEALKEAAEALEIAAGNGGVNFYQYAKETRAAIKTVEESK